MKVRLTQKDIQLLSFLGRYKVMLAADSKMIYKSKDYHFKRLKVLEKERYIKRINRYFIKLDINGVKLMKDFGYEYRNVCRKKEYQDRLREVVKIATLTLDSKMQFNASWDMKDNNIFTETARKYLGELEYQGKKLIAYYISKDKERVYIKQTINDIQKTIKYKDTIIFIENFKILNKSYNYFIFGKESTLIINPNKLNVEKMRILEKIDLYEILKQLYPNKEILLSNWKKADYMADNKNFIIWMPFIDTEKLHRLNIYFKESKKINREIDIITLKENINKINEILTNRTNTIILDNLLGGIDGGKTQKR